LVGDEAGIRPATYLILKLQARGFRPLITG